MEHSTTTNTNNNQQQPQPHHHHHQHQHQNQQEKKQHQEEGILFSCRCKSLKRIFTLLSSLKSTNQSGFSSSNTNTNTSILTTSNDLLASQNIARRAISLTNTDTQKSKRNKEQIAEIFVNSNGLTIHVYGIAKQSQASVDLSIGLFNDFYVCEEEMEIDNDGNKDTIVGGSFSINLTTLLECLHALDSCAGGSSYYTCGGGGNEIELCMSYSTKDAILKLELLERSYSGLNLIGSAALAGVESNIDGIADTSTLTIAFRSYDVLARAIIKSEYLRLAVVELEVAGATCCSLCIWNKGLELGVIGSCGESFVQLPFNGDGFVSLDAPEKYVLCTYPLYLLLQAFRGLEIADETCLTINSSQMLAIQHQVMDTTNQMNYNQPNNNTSEANYVDFIIASITDPSLEDEYHDELEEENAMSIQHGEDDDDDIPSISVPQQSDSQQNNSIQSPKSSKQLQPEPLIMNSSSTDKRTINNNDTSPQTSSPQSSSPPISNPRKRSSQSQSSSKNSNSNSSELPKLKSKQKTKKQQPFLFTLNDDEDNDSSNNSNNSNTSTTDEEESNDYYYFTPPTTPNKSGTQQQNSEQKESVCSSPELMFGDTSLANVEKNCLVRDDNNNERGWK